MGIDPLRDIAKSYAREYNLGNDEKAFDELWDLTMRARAEAAVHHVAALAEVTHQVLNLRVLADSMTHEATPFGSPVAGLSDDAFATVQVASTAGRYVIFSDHHMLDQASRQNFFRTGSGGNSGNRDLYVEVLEDYYGVTDYCLIENGDVEELLIYEPVLSEVRGIGDWSWAEIFDYRETKKLEQLEQIVRDNPDYYRVIAASFIARQKYLRITGNHDRDMRDQAVADIVSREAGIDFPRASDVVLLTDGSAFRYMICHGHQFDTACTPKYAAKSGECFSQASGWAYQGPDRFWRTDEDPIADWVEGRRAFANNLVTDEPDHSDIDELPILGDTFLDPLAEITGDIIDAIGALIGNLNTERGWENLYGKNIAWEYFDNAGDPQKCIDREVKTGRKWFKFRHMNEVRLVNDLQIAFAGQNIPTLILGHSHEPRFEPGRVVTLTQSEGISFYMNCASAGRFENLIWGIELIDGEPSLISWHRSTGSDAQPIRTIWGVERNGPMSWLLPASSARLAELLEDAETEVDDVPLLIAVEHAL